MPRIDRRKGGDRRRHDRHSVSIPVEWEDLSGRRSGTISDLSMSGCFLLTGGAVEDGRPVTIHFSAYGGKTVDIPGTIVSHVFEVGFAVKFVDLTDQQIVFLHRLMDSIVGS